ncbi:hypothetical protein J1N35_022717 [Gossypium stocksii]|uniref:CRM domain-containing protein n=1 Tax=Gossypium stocksii TaxID=47602 RepID=A0A9D4A1E7_9ROSI|nr:hypothetical protein J1N35_022717 [Gossypium stocksii]
MAAIASIRQISGQFTFSVKRESLLRFCCFVQNESFFPRPWLDFVSHLHAREATVLFSFNKPVGRLASINRKRKMSRKAKVNELRFYRLKAKKKMSSPNPEAKRKEAWLIEKLRKYEVPKAPTEAYDPEILTEEEIYYLKRTGEKKKNYVQVGRRGVFGGLVLNMHLHWKKHETVKVICKPCKPGKVYEYADELARLSKGIVIDIKPNNTIIFLPWKELRATKYLSPADTLSKNKVMFLGFLWLSVYCLYI